MTKAMIAIKNEIEKEGFYRLTAMATNMERNGIKKMVRKNMVTRGECVNGTYIDFYKNWI